MSTGDHSDWNERDTGFDRPDSSVLLGSFSGQWDTGKLYALPIDPTLLGADAETLILEMGAGSNDVSLHARHTADGPRLQLDGGSDFCLRYQELVDARQSNGPTDPANETTGPDQPDPTTTGNPDEPGTGGEPTGNDPSQTPLVTADAIENGLGAAPALVLLLFGAGLRRRQ